MVGTIFRAILILLIPVVGFAFFQGYQSAAVDAPAAVAGQLQACGPTPNCVSSLAETNSEYYVAPLPAVPENSEEGIAAIVAAIENTGGKVVKADVGMVLATYSTRIFRFVDDVQIIWTPGSDSVHVRSSSRVGQSDFGVNRKRVAALRAAMS